MREAKTDWSGTGGCLPFFVVAVWIPGSLTFATDSSLSVVPRLVAGASAVVAIAALAWLIRGFMGWGRASRTVPQNDGRKRISDLAASVGVAASSAGRLLPPGTPNRPL